jgi:hypothetical protein
MIRPLLLTVLAAASIAVTPPRAAARVGPALRSRATRLLQIHSIDEDTFEPDGLTTHENWSAGWSFVRPFEYGNERFAFLIKSTSGEAQVRELYSNGTMSDVIESYSLDPDFSSVEIYYPGGNPAVVLHERQTGKVAIWRFRSDGTLGEKTCGKINAHLKHKDAVRPFEVNGTPVGSAAVVGRGATSVQGGWLTRPVIVVIF